MTGQPSPKSNKFLDQLRDANRNKHDSHTTEYESAVDRPVPSERTMPITKSDRLTRVQVLLLSAIQQLTLENNAPPKFRQVHARWYALRGLPPGGASPVRYHLARWRRSGCWKNILVPVPRHTP